VGRHATEFLVQEDVPRLQEDIRVALETEEGQRTWQYTVARADGRRVPVEGFASAVHDENGRPTSFVVQIQDITARKEAEFALRETTDRLRAFSSRLQDVREEERTAISRELHDELGQAMTGLRMDLAMCADKLPDDRADLQERLSQMIRLADDNIALVQNISSQLRPPVLDVLGLGPAIEWLVEEVRKRSGLSFEMDLPDGELGLDPKTSIAAFRVVQEALTNVIRHAQAKKVRIRLATFEGQLMAEVADDGIGIPSDAVDHPRSVGLLGMSERAIAQGGSLSIEGDPGAGTRVLLSLPLAGVPQPSGSVP
jgi:signal transduction histidine kinase